MTTTEKLVPLDQQEAEEPFDASQDLILNMGPQHPSTHGVLRLVMRLRGERVVKCTPVIGYLHRGIEKIFESRTYMGGIRYCDQFEYISNMLNEHAYVGAAEALLGVEVPRRAEYIRVIVDELSRCSAHLVGVGTYVLDLGAWTPVTYCFRERERILDLFEALGGSRFNHNYFRVGGVLFDLPTGWLGTLEKFLGDFGKLLDELEELVSGNEIFRARTVGVGVIPQDVAVAYSLSGPNIRGSGVPFDMRTYRPYGAYPELDVQPQVRYGGDCFSRYEVRLYEMREAIRLCRLAMANLPGGPIQARVPHAVRPPKGEAYFTVEGAKGDLSLYMVSDGLSQNPYRAKVRGPSFVNLQILPRLVKGCTMADVVAILGSIDIVLGEVDR
ncbi:MAG: NADH-quinone oxidoreductase subunit D [Chloroflexi bacterium]|nr:NADH-quinone oxidoreductase subunit D [Chloroflexota bacterium]